MQFKTKRNRKTGFLNRSPRPPPGGHGAVLRAPRAKPPPGYYCK